MTNSEKKYYNKKFMPRYYAIWSKVMPVAVLVWFVGFIAAFLVSTFVFPEANAMSKIAIGFLIALLVLVVVFIAGTVVMNNKLTKQRAAELAQEYADMPEEEAKAALLARGVITEDGFIIPSMATEGGVVPKLPFNDATVYLFSANVCTKVLTVASICNATGGIMAEYLLDGELYNYLKNGGFNFVYYGGSQLLFGDKTTFVKKVIKTRENKGVGFAMLGGVLGAVLAANAKDETPEMEAVLRVLRRENI
ncbi:MAG: hypothetical protein K2N22_05865 [Clostridia bacterium]|nr:hypothetical protein [Clostridia bacterium]